ncbi:putative ATP synthase subunit f, mitochondrial isoform X1 [Diprion similis]|uniref:putative ATP synthase subunit f, mitochondrial isoform X1 n=1 Tax=Diprion similis TaxID=362088 RepID=UPI001EF8F324|nr:putative ATP synthase subunit f, mitochondrial isoform X1 [Diprion similis]
MGFGDYPAEYNRSIHGPYDPARYYGKPDTPFGQVKLNELIPWLGRRNKSPRAMVAAVSRAWWHWQHKYVHVKRGGIAPFFQLTAGAMLWFYVINYQKYKNHRNYKYH